MRKADVARSLSLSCVEAYFLAWLNPVFDVRSLFCGSFVPAARVFGDFAAGAEYETYAGFPRVQKLAEYYGVTEHELVKTFCLPDDGDGTLLLMRVGDAFTERLKVLPWREDHYVCLTREAGELRLVNNYPLFETALSEAEAAAFFDGTCLKFRRRVPSDASCFEALDGRQFENLLCQIEAWSGEIGAEGLRSALGVLKLSRKRVFAWLRRMAEEGRFVFDPEAEALEREMTEAYEKFFLRAELQSLRNRPDIAGNRERLDALFESEKKLQCLVRSGRRS